MKKHVILEGTDERRRFENQVFYLGAAGGLLEDTVFYYKNRRAHPGLLLPSKTRHSIGRMNRRAEAG